MNTRASPTLSPRRRRAEAAWLAIVALLINVLLPTAFVLAAPSDQPVAGIGFCGTAGRGPGSGNTPATAPGHHCIYCLVAAVGPAPAPPVEPAAPRLAATEAVAPLPCPQPLRRAAFALAQPRGPPLAA